VISWTAMCISNCGPRATQQASSGSLPGQPGAPAAQPEPRRAARAAKASVGILGWNNNGLRVRLGCPANSPSKCSIRATLSAPHSSHHVSVSVSLAPRARKLVRLRRPAHVSRKRLTLQVRTRTAAGVRNAVYRIR
jgi:hypothetical protein